MPGGRPSKFGPEVCERICHALALGASYKLAAKHGGIQYKTFNRWRKRGADGDNKFSGFADAVRRAEGEAAVKWLSHIEDAAEDGAWQAAAWKLERRYPESYSTRSRLLKSSRSWPKPAPWTPTANSCRAATKKEVVRRAHPYLASGAGTVGPDPARLATAAC